MMETMSIGELSARSGVSVSAVRYYERVGLLTPAARVGGRRRFTESALVSLTLIRLGQQAGLTLGELRSLRQSDGDGPGDPRWATVLGRKLEANAREMERLRRAQGLLTAALGCGCPDLAACARRDAAT